MHGVRWFRRIGGTEGFDYACRPRTYILNHPPWVFLNAFRKEERGGGGRAYSEGGEGGWIDGGLAVTS